MRRRESLGILGAAAVGLVSASARPSVAADDRHNDEIHKRCVKACADCAERCLKAFRHCFGMVSKGDAKHAGSMRMSADCAKFCALSADLMLTGSPLMGHACAACAEACKDCAAECEKVDGAMMKECVAACRDCEKACREMVREMASRA